MKLLFVSCISVTVEINNDSIYYTNDLFDVYLNGELVKRNNRNNIFSLFCLKPDTDYTLTINNENLTFHTDKVSKIYTTENICNDGTIDVTKDIQGIIDNAEPNSLIEIEEGKYLFSSLKLKSNLTLAIKKGAYLSASINENDYQEIDGEEVTKNGLTIQRGTWEGLPYRMKYAFINAIDCENIKIVGEGIIDGNAQLSTWWDNFKSKPYARPHMIFLNQSKNIVVQGIDLRNSPQWTIHPYFCKDVSFFDLKLTNPKISPNTDGINPQCCENVKIIGVHFSVGDDCIAIKSGKMYIGKKYKTPCKNIEISNCLMQYGHGAVVLGSEMSGGIKDLLVEKCIFDSTDRGLRIKTRRGRGDTAVIDGVTFSNIIMKNVLTPLVINMFYFCDPDGKTEYVWSKNKYKYPVNEETPYLGKFTFKDITAIDCEYAAGYFYGLPEQPIAEINIEDCTFKFKEDAGIGTPAMMSFAEKCHKRGFIFKNIKQVSLKNVNIEGEIGNKIFVDEGVLLKND